jgi:hypothetical protein
MQSSLWRRSFNHGTSQSLLLGPGLPHPLGDPLLEDTTRIKERDLKMAS